MPPYKPPKSGNLPLRGKVILRSIYVRCRQSNPGESHESKAKCARIAWAGVRRAGFTKPSYRKGA